MIRCEKLVFDSTSEIAIYGGFVGKVLGWFMGDYDNRASFSGPVAIDEILVKIKMKPHS